MADETKKYLDYDGLAHLVEKLDSKIASASSGTSGHTGACDGVYVAYLAYDGVKRICAPSDWADSLGAAQGVMVGDGTHEVMVSLTDKSYNYYVVEQGTSSYTTFKADGAIDTDDGDLAVTDLNGRANWAAIMEALEGKGIPYYSGNVCYDLPKLYYGATHAGEWWLPSLGELKLISDRADDVNSALSSVGGPTARLVVDHTYAEDHHWSSTQDGVNLWQMSLGTGDVKSYGKNMKSDLDSLLCPVAAWDYVL